MKKICMVNNNSSEVLFHKPTGGVKRFWELYFYLCSAGHDVDIVCGCTPKELEQYNLKGWCLNTTQDQKHSILSVPSLTIYRKNKVIYDQIKKENYDCVIAFDVPTTVTVCLARVKKVNFFIRQDLIKYRKIQYTSLNMSKIAIYLRLFIGWIMEGICISRSERIISQCEADLAAIRKRHPFLRGKINQKSRIQINNINPSWVDKNNETSESFKKYDVGFIGNFDDERKGHRILLEALDILAERGENYTAVILGDGEKIEEYKEKYKHLTNVIFAGYIDNPEEYIKSMRLMVVPSLSDSCPNTIMEALYNKIPVIGASRGGIPEILTNKEWMFDPDANQLADKIEDLIENKKLFEMKEAQSIRAEELTFNWGQAVEGQLT